MDGECVLSWGNHQGLDDEIWWASLCEFLERGTTYGKC